MQGKIVLCSVTHYSHAQTYEQFLQVTVGLCLLFFVCIFAV